MSREQEYERRIQQFGRNDLQNLWQSIISGNTPQWEPGRAFEYLICRAFQLEGAEIRWPYSVWLEGDEVEQIDGAVYSDGLACVIECKDTVKKVSVEPIAKLRNQLLRRPSPTVGLFFSRNGFTGPAETLAQFTAPQTILLWTGDEVAYAINNGYLRRGLLMKYRFCVEEGIPNYDFREKDE